MDNQSYKDEYQDIIINWMSYIIKEAKRRRIMKFL